MMLNTLTTVITLAFANISQVSQAETKTVLWALNEAPPFHMAAGPERGQGFCEKLVAAAIRATPELTHEVQYLPNLRVEMLWQNNQNLCFPCMIHSKQPQSEIIHSKITHNYPPHGIITRSTTAASMIAEFGNPLNLAALSAAAKYRFVQPAGRGYGILQPLVTEHILSDLNTTVLTGDHGTASMFAMIAGGRVDYTIDYPFVMDYFAAAHQGEFQFVPIEQNYQQQLAGAMACTDNPWGRQVIGLLNQRIDEIRYDPEFIHALDRWLPTRPKLAETQE